MDTPHPPDLCGSGYRYPRQVRDLAFQLWAFKCSRNVMYVTEELTATGAAEGWDCVPGERTLRHWATKGEWPAAAARALRSLIPELAERAVTDLLMAAAEGMPYLRDVVAGRVAQPNSTRIRAILTVQSMVGGPDQAHTTVREAMRERDEARGHPASDMDKAVEEPESLALVKERIALRLGYGREYAAEDDA